MKIYVNLMVLIAMSFPQAYAAETTFKSSVASLALEQQPIILKLDKSTGETKLLESSALECNQSFSTFKNEKLDGLAKANQNVSKYMTCSETKNLFEHRFSTSSCKNAIVCRKNVSQMQVNSKGTDDLMNEIIAKDYAKNVLDQQVEVMDRLEILKQFAKQKFDINSDKCQSRYEPRKGGVCNLPLLEQVFVSYQNKCKFGNSCFNKLDSGILSFEAFSKKEQVAKNAFVLEYNQYRIGERIKGAVNTDSDYLNELADLVTSEEFQKATQDKRSEMFLAKMESGAGDRYRDPVLAFDFDSVSDKAQLKSKLKFDQLSKIFNAGNVTKDSFKSEFNNFRKSRAEAILSDAGSSCSGTSDIKRICEDMTALSLGKTLPKDSLAVEHLSSKDLKSEKDFERFKSIMGETFNANDFDTLVDAKRCLSFGLASEEYNDMASNTHSRSGIVGFGTIAGSMAGAPDQSSVDKSREKITSYMGDIPGTKNESSKLSDTQMSESAEAISNSSLNNALADASAVTSSNFANQFNQSFTPSSYGIDDEQKDDKAEKKEEAVVAAPTTVAAAPADNMNDLMKRLAAAEEKVDKMKAANEEAEANRVKQKKIDEENALIKDLKNQISDLKSIKEKKESAAVVVSSPVVEQPKVQAGNVYASSYNSGSANAPARQESAPKAADNFDSGRQSNSGSNAVSSGGRNAMNSVMLTSSGSADNNKAASTGMLITTIDGMSTEKAAQTISTRILELNGSPFYIEEGGMVKEIIAVVKDGKVLLDEKGNPIFEKIVKGKVGDKKFAKVKEKNRAPAAITDAADLKRDQEEKMKRERAEYLKLKNLTNRVIKNK